MELQTSKIDEVASDLVTLGGSDLHLKVGAAPMIRIHGELGALEGH